MLCPHIFSSVWSLLPIFDFSVKNHQGFSVKKEFLPPKHNITQIKKLGFEFFERA